MPDLLRASTARERPCVAPRSGMRENVPCPDQRGVSPVLFRQLFDPDTSTYSYLLADEESREAVIIDRFASRSIGTCS